MDKYAFGLGVVACCTAILVSSHYFGVNGKVFALCSAVIGGVVGTVLGIKIKTLQS